MYRFEQYDIKNTSQQHTKVSMYGIKCRLYQIMHWSAKEDLDLYDPQQCVHIHKLHSFEGDSDVYELD